VSRSLELVGDTLRIQTPRVFVPLLQPARYKGAHGGRGSGKSHFFAEQAVEKCLNGERGVCIREVQKSLKQSAKLLIEDKIRAMGLSDCFNIRVPDIEGPNGGLIIFEGMQNHNQESIKSLEGFSWAWVEEAQTLSQSSLDMLRPTIRRPGSELWFSWNPRKKEDPVDKFFRGGEKPPRSICVEANYDSNPWLPDVLKEELEYDRRRDPVKFKHIWEGGYWVMSDALVFKNWRVEEFDTPLDAEFKLGADWGFSIDPTVLVRMFLIGNTLYIDHEAYQVGCRMEAIPQLFAKVPQSSKWPLLADSARPETIDYVRRHGFPRMMPAKKGAGSVEDGIEFLQNYDIVIHPRCKRTMAEFAYYSYKIDKKTNEVLPVLADNDNHVIDAVRYALETTRRSSYSLRNVS
jgi:phage terminase large subunit